MKFLKSTYLPVLSVLFFLIAYLFIVSYYPGKLNAGFYSFKKNGLKPYFTKLHVDKNAPKKVIKKEVKSKKMKGSGLIPDFSSDQIDYVGDVIEYDIDSFSSFLSDLDKDYIKSAQIVESVKIGNQRLIEGGKKSVKKSDEKHVKKSDKKTVKKSDKKTVKKSDKEHVIKKSDKEHVIKKIDKKSVKKSDKKSVKKSDKEHVKKSDKKIKKGGNGSDFASTLNSRGPSNAPDDYWGVPGEEWFRQFNKTGDYIPNSKLQFAATPLLAGRGDSDVVSGYSDPDLNYRF
jgi:hypothetical protein